MIWYRLKLFVLVGTAVILASIVGGTALLLQRSERSATLAAQAAVERSAQAAENALNRQLLQVHGALTSLPSVFSAAGVSPRSTDEAASLLRGLNFQTLAYHNLLLVDDDGTVLATGRPRRSSQPLPFALTPKPGNPTSLIGPVRTSATGDWAIYLARSLHEWNGVTPLAEVPTLSLMEIIAEAGVDPRARIFLERPDGQLIAALPHDEVETGRRRAQALGTHVPDGTTFRVPANGRERERFAVVRTSLFPDIRVVVTAERSAMMAEFRRDRLAMAMVALSGGVLVSAFSGAAFVALRQRERVDAERLRAASVLVDAIEAMSDGFVMWDENDRFVTCNQRYRDLYGLSAPFLVPGAQYEEVLRSAVSVGQYPQATGDPERFIADMMAWHREGRDAVERLLPDGSWILIRESRMADGGVVGIRTEITALKTTLAELAEANARANEAAEEARRQNAALTERESQIRFLAHHDDLTGLPNRVLFRDRLLAARDAAAEQNQRVALLYLDLDRFKDINDTLGHPVGDALLQAVAARLIECVGDPDRVARLGGDEFAVISLSTTHPGDAEQLSARIIETLGRPYRILGHTIVISVSVGISVSDGTEADADLLLKQADMALYVTKARERGAACVFVPEMGAALLARLDMETDLRDALERNQFSLVYQPVFRLESQGLCGFEALLRWHHPQLGAVSPDTFIPLAEETGLIVEIGAFVLRQACTDALRFPGDVRVAVNLSPVQLSFGDIVATVASLLAETGLDPARLELEITETALFADEQRNIEALQRLRALGVRIVLDDFGTGYSSLSHLHLFPLDKIKIDRSFVRDMAERADSAVIVEAIASLAVRLGMTTTAEGIESAEQCTLARRYGCTEGQGYFLGEPRALGDALASAATAAAAETGRPARANRVS